RRMCVDRLVVAAGGGGQRLFDQVVARDVERVDAVHRRGRLVGVGSQGGVPALSPRVVGGGVVEQRPRRVAVAAQGLGQRAEERRVVDAGQQLDQVAQQRGIVVGGQPELRPHAVGERPPVAPLG